MLRLAADEPDRVAGVVVVNPALATKRLDVRLLPVLKHVVPSFPGITNDIKKPGIEEHSRGPRRAAHSMFRAWPLLIADLPQVTSPLLYFRSTVDHVVDELSSRSSSAGCPRGTSRSAGSRSTSPPSTTTRRRSSRSPPTSSHGSPPPRGATSYRGHAGGSPLTPPTKPV